MQISQKLFSIPIIADGSPQTLLHYGNDEPEAPIEKLNLNNPEKVREAHEEYIQAGAKLIRTNTRAANSQALETYGLADHCEAINLNGSALLRSVLGEDGFMMGSIGEILPADGKDLPPLPDRERAYSEQIIYLSDAGATFLLLEHFSSLDEALLALRIAGRASDAQVLAQLRFDARGLTREGIHCLEAGERLIEEGAGALGISCGPNPEAIDIIVDYLLPLGLPVSVMLGIGGNERDSPYPGAAALSPQEFSETLAPLADRGVAILGGCCGVFPSHITALAERIGKKHPKA